MRIILVVLSAVLFASLCAAGSVTECLSGPEAVTSDLVVSCYVDTFDFGHDLHHNPSNPLPGGGSLTLKSLGYQILSDGYPEWDLDFGFSHPSIGTTELDFSVFGKNGNYFASGVSFFALGRSPSPFGTRPPNDSHNTPNETGSNFLITETVNTPSGLSDTLSVCGGDSFPPCLGSIVNAQSNFLGSGGSLAVGVVTKITDNAGDLTGFDEAFAIPEPASWILVLGGLLGICKLRSRGMSRRRVRPS